MTKKLDSLKKRMEKLSAKEKSIKEQLATERKQIAARIRQAEAKEKSKTRKEDTRRKILVGSLVLSRLEKEESFSVDSLKQLKKELNGFLTRPLDRKMFDL